MRVALICCSRVPRGGQDRGKAALHARHARHVWKSASTNFFLFFYLRPLKEKVCSRLQGDGAVSVMDPLVKNYLFFLLPLKKINNCYSDGDNLCRIFVRFAILVRLGLRLFDILQLLIKETFGIQS